MRPSSTVALAVGVVAGLAALPPHADAATRHPAPEPAGRALSSGRHTTVPGLPARSRAEVTHGTRMPVGVDTWPGLRAISSRPLRQRPDEPAPADDEEAMPDSPVPLPGTGPSTGRPPNHRSRTHRGAPFDAAPASAPHAHLAPPARSSTAGPFRDGLAPGDARPPAGAASICVDIDVVAVVRVIIQVGCDCEPPPRRHHHRPRPPSPRPPSPRPSPARPSPPRKARPAVAERAAVVRRSRPSTPSRGTPETPSPSLAPTHRAVTPRAAAPPRRKNPMATLLVLVILTVVISAGAGMAFAGIR